MQEKALDYEYTIRHLRGVGRLGVPAAHADLYRRLETLYVKHERINDNSSLANYMFYLGKVNSNIQEALHKFGKDYDEQLTEDEKDQLETIDTLLWNEPSMENTDNAIEQIKVLVANHGIII